MPLPPVLEQLIPLVKRDVKTLSADELAKLLGFLTPDHDAYWTCVVGPLGYIVSITGGPARLDTSYSFRLIDARENPALTVHQYRGLGADPQHSQSALLLEFKEQNRAVFEAFGQFLIAADPGRRPKSDRHGGA